MMGLIPNPPTCRKPQLNWSLLRRYSLIVPPVKIPIQTQVSGEYRKLDEAVGTEVSREPPSNALPTLIVQGVRDFVPSGPETVQKNPKLLKLHDFAARRIVSQIQKPNLGVRELKVLTSPNPNETIPLLKNDVIELKPENISLIRVPKTYNSPKPRGSADDLVQKFKSLPLLQLPTSGLDAPEVNETHNFRLIKMEQITLLGSTRYMNSLKSDVLHMPSRSQAPPIRLLDLRKLTHSLNSANLFTANNRNSGRYKSTFDNTMKGSDCPDLTTTGSRFQLLRMLALDNVAQRQSPVPALSDRGEQSACSSTENSGQENASVLGSQMEHTVHEGSEEHAVQTSHCLREDKMVSTVAVRDFGMQFDDILEDDAFIFRNYIIGKDGVRRVEDSDRKYLHEPLANQSFFPGQTVEPPIPLVNLSDIFKNHLMEDENQFLSVCSMELSELDTAEPNRCRTEVEKPMELCLYSGVDKANEEEPVQRRQKTDSEVQCEPAQFPTSREVAVDVCLTELSPRDDQSFKTNQTTEQKPFSTWLGEGASRVRLDVVKALSELDVRLSAVDRVSSRLEEEHQKNQELLERLIQLRPIPGPPKSEESPRAQSPEHDRLNVNESNGKAPVSPKDCYIVRVEGLGSRKSNPSPSLNARLPPTTKPRSSSVRKALHDPVQHGAPSNRRVPPAPVVRRHICSTEQLSNSVNIANGVIGCLDKTMTSVTGGGPFEPVRRSRQQSVGSLLRKREQSRIERNSAFLAKRCSDAVRYAVEVLDQNGVLKFQPVPITGLESHERRHSNRRSTTAGQSRHTPSRLTRMNVLFPRSVQNTQRSLYNHGTSSAVRRGRTVRRKAAGRVSKQYDKKDLPLLVTTSGTNDNIWDDEEQTTIISEWSLESGVKRILYEKQEEDGGQVNYVNEQYAEGHSEGLFKMPQITQQTLCTEVPDDAEQLTDPAAPASTSYVDWEEVDELIKDQ
ncbi:hypothetical protein D915_002478 [Fasciola hepatica]|uniref:Uncharacterized protein n=1 Tax=Fasciola hepatica TaxID=6192 RepID=A0A4E0RGD1_FASHE|nr:hypothetical protein D915_002478 [Fasciola hepatica]